MMYIYKIKFERRAGREYTVVADSIEQAMHLTKLYGADEVYYEEGGDPESWANHPIVKAECVGEVDFIATESKRTTIERDYDEAKKVAQATKERLGEE